MLMIRSDVDVGTADVVAVVLGSALAVDGVSSGLGCGNGVEVVFQLEVRVVVILTSVQFSE